MRFHKKEGKGIGFGELIPILYPDQQITIDTFRKLEKEFREGKRKRRLTEEELYLFFFFYLNIIYLLFN